MATHSSILAWEIPWMGEPGGLQPVGSQRVGVTTEQLNNRLLQMQSPPPPKGKTKMNYETAWREQ